MTVDKKVRQIIGQNMNGIEEDPVNRLEEFAEIYLPSYIKYSQNHIKNYFLDQYNFYKDKDYSDKEIIRNSAKDTMTYILKQRRKFQKYK